jgi:hypothetical protein
LAGRSSSLFDVEFSWIFCSIIPLNINILKKKRIIEFYFGDIRCVCVRLEIALLFWGIREMKFLDKNSIDGAFLKNYLF